MNAVSFLSMVAPLLVKGAEAFAPLVASWFHPATTPEEKAAIESTLADARTALDAQIVAEPGLLHTTDDEIKKELT